MSAHRILAAGLVLASLGSCRQNDDPEGARQLHSRITSGAGFRSAGGGAWRRAPGYPDKKPSFTLHGREVAVFVNKPIADALAAPNPIRSWPEGSIIVKESYDEDDVVLLAVMEKRTDGWYWAEYDGDGEPIYSGKPQICTDCHA